MKTRFFAATLALSTTLLTACGQTQPGDAEPNSAGPATAPVVLGEAVQRRALFGDLHVHTQNSFDAFAFGVRRTADDAYRFAQGEPIAHDGGFQIQLQGKPLDFYAVTDHGEYLGIVRAMSDVTHPLSKTETARSIFGADAVSPAEAFRRIGISFVTGNPIDEINDREAMAAAWQGTVEAAEAHNQPGQFTTFSAYEFTAMRALNLAEAGALNLHRNVIFADSAPSEIMSTLDSVDPADLWRWMDRQREEGHDALAIPHNSNASNGEMFALATQAGEPLPEEQLALRRRNEPLVEITQIKGTSDTHPLFSPNDEWADFEHYPVLIGSNDVLSTPASGSFVRPTLGAGLMAAANGGVNPFEFGLIGSSDTHIAAGTYVEEKHWGKFPLDGSSARARNSIPPEGGNWDSPAETHGGDPHAGATASYYSASGLAGVWAADNTRAEIFAALSRRETFATSGPRMQVRFFAGAYEHLLLDSSDMIEMAYQEGVPMGGQLVVSESPTFLVWALQDPQSAPLDRAQIIKVWYDDAQTREQVFDVACSSGSQVQGALRCADNGASVDVGSCEMTAGKGVSELKALWQDPTYEASQAAVYYVRVLENPSCRWSTWDAVRNGTPPNPALPATLQERAWSSPIWVNPISES